MGSSTLITTLFELSGGEVEVVAKEDLSKIIFSMSGVWASDFCSSSFGESTQICTIGYGIESRGDESNYKIYFIRKKRNHVVVEFLYLLGGFSVMTSSRSVWYSSLSRWTITWWMSVWFEFIFGPIGISGEASVTRILTSAVEVGSMRNKLWKIL